MKNTYKENMYKEWTDHKNGYRYYVDYLQLQDKVRVCIAKYPDGDTLFKTEFEIMEFRTFLKYLQDEK